MPPASLAVLSLGLALLPGVQSLVTLPVKIYLPSGAAVEEDGKLGAVASESSICSKIGIDLLKAGGNAADAAVGTTFCVGVVGMAHSGIGGGGFMTIRPGDGPANGSAYEVVDFRETAPAASCEDMFTSNQTDSLWGGMASAVPGETRGLEYLHTRYGSLPWKQVLQPAIQLARFGFPVGEDLLHYMNVTLSKSAIGNFFVNDPTWALDFAPTGKLLSLGDIMTRKRYANTLETIATQGADAFYTGAIAETTIRALQRQRGIMTLEDLANYTVAIRQPVTIPYRGYKLTTSPAPSGGIVALSALKILDGYQLSDPPAINQTTHYLDEAIKFAYGQRTQLGDPHFVPGLDDFQTAMLADKTVDHIRSKMTAQAQDLSRYDPQGIESLATPGTAAIVVADQSGLAISLTTTINLHFGSKLMVPETGVIMNNEMNDFSIPGLTNAFGYVPSKANFIRPGKRPLSSITPTIVECSDGSLHAAVASAGGSAIITAVIQLLHFILDRNMTALQAVAAPRLHDQLVPQLVSFETTYDNATVDYMRSVGHNVTWTAPGVSAAQALRRLANGTFEAAGETRQVNSGGFAV